MITVELPLNGRAIPSCGYRTQDMTDDEVGTAQEYFPLHDSAEASRSWQEFDGP